MALPLVKLGALLLKTAVKPVAARLKVETGRSPKFRQLIINIAQMNHRFTTQMQRQLYGHSTDVAIRPLNEEKAVQAATDLIGEIFVFTVAGAIVIFEVQRSAKSEAHKEARRRQELEAVEKQSKDLAMEFELLRRKVEELEQQSKGRGLSTIFSAKSNVQPVAKEDAKSIQPVAKGDAEPSPAS